MFFFLPQGIWGWIITSPHFLKGGNCQRKQDLKWIYPNPSSHPWAKGKQHLGDFLLETWFWTPSPTALQEGLLACSLGYGDFFLSHLTIQGSQSPWAQTSESSLQASLRVAPVFLKWPMPASSPLLPALSPSTPLLSWACPALRAGEPLSYSARTPSTFVCMQARP